MTDTTTRTISIPPSHLGEITERLASLKSRAAKKNWEVTLGWSHTLDRDENGDVTATLTVEYGGSFNFEGGWRLAAVADATGTDTPLVFSFGEDVEVGPIDMTRCDHCGRAIRRNRLLILVDEAGRHMHVGGNCSVDFLGHDPEWAFWIGEATDGAGHLGEPTSWPLDLALAYAIDAFSIGYRRSGESDSNKDIVIAYLTGRIGHRDWKEIREAIEAARVVDGMTVEEVREWMLNESGDGEFGSNMRAIAESENVGFKALGLIAYAPAGVGRWRDKMAEAKAAREAAEARRETAPPVPVGRVRITGTVTTIKNVESDYGTTVKIRVMSDEGWAVWGTAARALLDEGIDRGDKVTFMATIERSRDDEKFGFFSRPSKAEVVERAKVPA